MRVSTVTVGVFKGREPWGVHSQKSDSLRRQHLPWVTMAGQRQTPPKMPTHEEANTRPQHQSRLPRLQTLHQVGHGQPQAAAPSESSSQSREAASRPRQLVPSPRVCCGEWDAAGRMQSCRRAPCSPTANTTAAQETNRCLLRDSESSMMLVERARRDQVRAARSSKAPAPKPVHDPHEHGSTSAAGRVSVPASMGTRHVGPGHQARAVQQGSKAPVGRYKCILIGKSVRSQRRVRRMPEDMTNVADCSRKEEDPQKLKSRFLAHSQHRRRGSPAGSPASMAAHVRGKHWAKAERALVPQVPKNHPGALSKLGCWEDISTKELSQEEDIKNHSTRVNPLFPELQEGPCRPRSSGTHAAGVTAGHQQDASPDQARSTNTEPAAAALAAAAEEEEQRSPLAPTEQEAAKAPASLFSKQGTAAQTGSQAPAPHSPTAHTVALQDTAQWDISEVLLKKPAEEQDSESSMMLVERARTDQVGATRSSKALAPKPVHDPHEHGNTSTAGRVSVPTSMGTRLVGPGHQARAVQQGSQAPVGRYKCILIGKSVRSQRRARRMPEDMTHVADCSRKEEDMQKLKSRFLAHSQQRRRGSPAGSPASMAAHVRGKHWAKAERALVPQVPKNHPGALAKLDSWEDISTKELSQEEDIKIHSIWDAAQWDVSEVRHKRPAEKQDSKSSMMLVERARRDQVRATRSSKAPAPKPVHDPHEHGSTSAAGRVSVPASMGTRHVGPGHQARAVQQGSKAPVGHDKCILIGKSVRSQRRVRRMPEDMTHVADCSRKEEDPQKLKSRFLAHSQHRRRGSPAGSPASMAAHVRGKHWAKAERALVPQVPKNHPGALAKLDSWEDISTKELSQEEDIKIYSIWDAAWWDMSDVLHELEAVIQERSQQLVEQRHSAQSMDAAMAVKPRAATEDSESTLAAEPRGEPSTASPVPDECQDGEHMASPMSGDHPGEASAAIISPAAHDHEGAFLLPENAVDNTATPHLAPAAENGDNETACPLPWEPWHQEAPGVLAKEDDKWEDISLELFQDPHAVPPEGQAASEQSGNTSPCSGSRDEPEDEPGTSESSAASARAGPVRLSRRPAPRPGRQDCVQRGWPFPGHPSLGKALGGGEQAGPCPLPAQPLAYSSPSSTGIAALPHTPARRRRPSLFRRVLRALRRAFSCTCITAQREQQRPAASGAHEGAGCP
ncbi:uncharacterized protein LOC119142173 [Falco rusticolus]|uniref:uncharacterized protein LOC119142173 n=2 Tax=Falco rusticolus TaxID=120794 RepID=UPI001886A100|nr:uncharacterized protein LOC119142173 [Falco rusticolus]